MCKNSRDPGETMELDLRRTFLVVTRHVPAPGCNPRVLEALISGPLSRLVTFSAQPDDIVAVVKKLTKRGGLIGPTLDLRNDLSVELTHDATPREALLGEFHLIMDGSANMRSVGTDTASYDVRVLIELCWIRHYHVDL